MSAPRPMPVRRARPVFEGPTYKSPQYHSRLWGRMVFILFVLLLVGLIGVGGGLYWALHRAQGSSSQNITFNVGTGDTVDSVANHLHRDGLIDNTLFFKLDARIQGLAARLKPGEFTLRRTMSIDDMVHTLSVYSPVYLSLLVPEGWRAEQIAARLQSEGVDSASFLQEVRHPDPKFLGASILADKPATATLEGYLYPNTYDIALHAGGKEVARQMVQQLDRVFTPALRVAARRHGMSVFQALTLASIVEREARAATDRPLIAGVYANRLRLGMKLDADPTVQYTQGTSSKWWPVLTNQAVSINPTNPYNTYTHAGLPPGPIASPGLASISAAVAPQGTQYLYFIACPREHNKTVFARTLNEQTANQARCGS